MNKEIDTVEVLTYDTPHKKTYDTVCFLKFLGYKKIRIWAMPMSYSKNFSPLIFHRPNLYDCLGNGINAQKVMGGGTNS